ncbi:ExeM/NucH family extracellular endonuclease [Nocardioides sp. SYSU D00038]|uniref:ExeM/NucH family extracellular endonuclease n=1 Tax=Nocardioides sp. SYSU D00038 TaxID=2812554 RepID=UPI001967AE9F|nr:ExeM/NucH family extracellular endonuclease [Nocardioides sp. SYSU D00038]
MSSLRKRIAGALGLGVAVAGLSFVATPAANAAPPDHLVITEVYLNGGSAGATYANKFVELYNPTAAPIPLTGLSVQYRSPTGTGNANGKADLSGDLAPGDYYVIKGGSNGAVGGEVPNVDQTATGINPGGGGGTVFIASGTALVNPASITAIDKVGYGNSNSPEGTVAGTASVTTTIQRAADGTDTNDNAADFSATDPTPGAPRAAAGTCPTAPQTIAGIQGTGANSACANQAVTTTGVVTAAYPTGGFNGFYIQTPGADATPDASDGIFVYGGPGGFATYPEVGASVQVTGTAKEFNGLTEIEATNAGVTSVASLGTVVPKTVVPGTDCALPGTGCLTGAALDAAREKVEGEVFEPTGDVTVTDVYDGSPYNGGSNSNAHFGEIGLAAGSATPLYNVTEVVDAQDAAGVAARTAYNNAHRLILDDGSSTKFWDVDGSGQEDQPFPWLTQDHTVRVGAAVTFPEPVVLDFRFGWRLQPTEGKVVGEPEGIEFEQDRPAAPTPVEGDLKLATFNVLNYFTTLGEDVPGCVPFEDRAGNPLTVDECEVPEDNGPRGAWNEENFERQQAKIVNSINALDADVVTLEEIENSRKVDGANRDEAVAALVDALNEDAGTERWDYVVSPGEAGLPPVAIEDVIRTAFIYNPQTVETVGASQVLVGVSAFDNAREPFAQAFKAKGGDDADGFAVIANHFKSKSGSNDGTGQGGSNPDRVAQANALVTFADSFATARGVQKVFLSGDFNAYSKEDPIQVLEAAGYVNLESTTEVGEKSYNFDGGIGSLDHILANEVAAADVKGVDIWTTNGYESVYYEYGRRNYNVTDLYDDGPFRASDHNPEIVGFDVADTEPAEREIQILGTNDFHGRLTNNSSGTEAGAAVLAGAVKSLRAQNPDTVFAAAGDLIGASTFDSFIQQDNPTIDALNEAGLDVSAVGNHEFDQGFNDLKNRVIPRAQWKYIGANVKYRDSGDPALEPSFVKAFGSVEVGFIGAVTEDLESLVRPDGIAQIRATDIVEAVNAEADLLEADGVDLIVLLVHEGAGGVDLASATAPNTPFGEIVNGVDPNIDAIVSGHTHLAYNHSIPVPAWVTEGRDVTERPVVSAGQYGSALNQLVFTVDTATGEVTAKTQALLNLKTGQTANYPADPATAAIVQSAVTAANELGKAPLGEVAAPFHRAKFEGGAENRGGESTLGNLVAEVQRWATETPEAGAAEIAFMNPGGLRGDMLGGLEGETAYPRTLTYRQAADVQSFANTLVNMRLTGAAIKQVLEQQWQTNPGGQAPARPFLRLGTSKGFEFTYDPDRAEGDRITGIWLHGQPIKPGQVYSVTANSFLAGGGDNFRAFNLGTSKKDTGKVDLQAMVDYMAEFADEEPLDVDYSQHAVGISPAAGEPATYQPGAHVKLDVSSFAMTGPGDVVDDTVDVSYEGAPLGSFPVTVTLSAAGNANSNDEAGKATVDVVLPADIAAGPATLTLKGAETGTEVTTTVQVERTLAVTADDVTITWGESAQLVAEVTGNDGEATGSVEFFAGNTSLGTADVVDGVATLTLAPRSLSPATREITAVYSGDDTYDEAEVDFDLVVEKAAVTVTAADAQAPLGTDAQVQVAVTSEVPVAPTGTVEVYDGDTLVGEGTLSGGQADVAVDTDALGVGASELEVRYLGSAFYEGGTDTAVVTVATAAVTVTAPNVSLTYGQARTVAVQVSGGATGTVEIRSGATVLGSAAVVDGVATVTLPARSLAPGARTLTAAYLGDAATSPASDTFTATVSKAASSVSGTISPKPVKVKKTKVSLTIKVSAPAGVPVTGKVSFKVDGKTKTKTLVNGKVVVNLGKFKQKGSKSVKITYLGSDLLTGSTRTVTFTVR